MHFPGTDNRTLGLSGEELMARVFDDFFYGVTVVNADSEIIYYNGAQARIDGLSPEDALGKSLDQVHRPEGRTAPTLAAALSRTPAVNRPFLYRTASGRLVNSVQNAYPITRDGELLGCVTFIGECSGIMDAFAQAAASFGGAPPGDALPPSAGAGAFAVPPPDGSAGSAGLRSGGGNGSAGPAPGKGNGSAGPAPGNGNGSPGPAPGKGNGSRSLPCPDGSAAPCQPPVIVSADQAFLEAVEAVRKAALSPSPILFCGEPGVGKSLLAREAAACSARKSGPFLTLDLSSAPENILEALLFGTEEGAHTGAVDRPGILEIASGGTVYLDGITSLPKALQDRLLAAVEEGRATRLGAAARPREFDVKFLSSAACPLGEAASSGRVSPGLLARLGVVTLNLAPLRERPADIPLLTGHFLKARGLLLGKAAEGVSDEVMEAFRRHSWPGNARELESGIEGALNALAPGELLLRPFHFSATFLGGLFLEPGLPVGARESGKDGAQRKGHCLQSAAEAERIAAALEAAGGNAAKAARSLKISPQLMNYKLKKFSLKKKITVQVG